MYIKIAYFFLILGLFMIKRWLSYLLIALIACHSVLAVADNYGTHTKLPKIEFKNNYDQADSVQSELTAKNTTPIVIIDNCGFCHHGQLVHSLLSPSPLPNTFFLNDLYNDAAPNGTASFLYRPPKA